VPAPALDPKTGWVVRRCPELGVTQSETTMPNQIGARYGVYTDPDTGMEVDVEGVEMCSLVDKFCLLVSGDTCDIYEDT